MGRFLEIRSVFVVALMALFAGAACSGGPAPSATATQSPGQIIDDGSGDDFSGGNAKGKGGKGAGGGNLSGGGGGGSSSGGGGVPADATDGNTVSATGQVVSEKEQAERARRLAQGLPDVNLWPAQTAQM